MASSKQITIYTDGSSLGNPGPGGYGAVLLYHGHRRELSGGFRRTTNNRMELLAAIEGLRALREPCRVTLYTDSNYLVNGITKGWAKRWRSKGWMRNKRERALNADLWAELLELCETHDVDFVWVKAHAGNEENERCDTLAKEAAQTADLAADVNYEQETMHPRSQG